MKARQKKQQDNDVARLSSAAMQTKLLPDVRSMDSPFSKPETAQSISQEEQGRDQGFNFAEMPIFAAGSGVAASPLQRKYTVSLARGQQEGQAPGLQKVTAATVGRQQPVQRSVEEQEEPMQGKLEPVQREEGEDEEPMQGKGESDQKVKAIQPKINLATSGGSKSMPEPVQQKMEGAFGADFSGVRIHEGPQAKAINAIAYTQGENIHFQPGKYQPDTQSGQELLGHELTHVVQQKAGRVTVPQGKGSPINADPGLESEADILGAKAARGESVEVAGASSTTIQRKWLGKNSQVLTAKNDISLKQSFSHSNIRHGQKLFKPESTNVAQQSSESAIQMKRGNIEQLDPEYVNIGFLRDSKTDIIFENINIYNDDVDVNNTNYEKQEKILGKIMKNSRKWLAKYQEKENGKKIEAIRKIHLDALREKAFVDRQKMAANPEQGQKEGSVFTESMLGGKTGKIGKIGQAAGIAANVGAGAWTGKTLIEWIKSLFSTTKEATEQGKGWLSSIKDTIMSFLNPIMEYLTNLAVPAVLFGMALKNIVSAYKDIEGLSATKRALEVKAKKSEQLGEEEQQLLKDVQYGYNKVERRWYGALYGVMDSVLGLVSGILAVFVPLAGTTVAALVSTGRMILNGLKTLALKTKGIWKYFKGTRGKNRRESAERTVKLAHQGNQEALQLLVGFRFATTPEEMHAKLLERTTEQKESFINEVAEKLKSQT